MSHESLKVLLVHDITGSRREIGDLLSKTGFVEFELDCVNRPGLLRFSPQLL